MVIVILLIVGLCLGSFVNALVWRLHEQSLSKSKASNKKLSILYGRSLCPSCHHKLSTLDLIPVVSWITLGGKCRYCKKPISWQYPLVELITAMLVVISWYCWSLPLHGSGLFEFILWIIFVPGFVALAVYDLRWFILPTRIIRCLILLVVLQIVVVSVFYHGGFHVIIEALAGSVSLGGIFYFIFIVSKGTWIGGGDVRLGFLLGLITGGLWMSIMIMFIASLLGTLMALPLLIRHRLQYKSRIPFGPFLLTGVIITKLFGHHILNWYLAHLLGVQ